MDVLRLKGDTPDFSTKIAAGVMIVSVDGAKVPECPEASGRFDLRIPTARGVGPRWIKLQMTGTDVLPSSGDGRSVSVHLNSSALEQKDEP